MLNGYIDLRSDTVTQPTPEMRAAMMRAELGDDVFGDDPTVNRLEEIAAAKMGKAAAVFVASGTMGNLTSLLTHCRRGEEVIVGDQAHNFRYEAGGSSALGGIAQFQIPNNPDGTLPLDRVEAAIRGGDQHEARVSHPASASTAGPSCAKRRHRSPAHRSRDGSTAQDCCGRRMQARRGARDGAPAGPAW